MRFRPLYFRGPDQASEDWIVGHEPSDTAVALPHPGIVAIQSLQTGATITQAHQTVFQRCGDDIDVADLVVSLTELGLVEALGEQHMPAVEAIGQRWLARISPASVAWLYSAPLLLLYAGIVIAGPVLLLLNAAIRPQAHDLFWSASYAVDTLTLVLLTPAIILKHELGHLLAGRGKGLSGELTFGYRLIYVVAVSRIAGVWKLRRRDRLLIYGAGMLNDLVFAGAGVIVLFAAQTGLIMLSTPLKGLIALLVLSEYLGVAWEFQVFLKTDVYHILADLTGRHDLPEQARALLTAYYRRLLSRVRGASAANLIAAHQRGEGDWLTRGYML
ncbi:MAG: hypothetical protein ACRDHP_14720, partial [Ktedonobacterales bacterium]